MKRTAKPGASGCGSRVRGSRFSFRFGSPRRAASGEASGRTAFPARAVRQPFFSFFCMLSSLAFQVAAIQSWQVSEIRAISSSTGRSGSKRTSSP